MDNRELTLLDALLSGDSSGAIERSEKREQQEAVKNQRLPIIASDHFIPKEIINMRRTDSMSYKEIFEIREKNNKDWTKEQYERMDIAILDIYDDLFYSIQLPIGWKIKRTEHAMWNDVFDNKGRKRMSFFYKGSFYDRDAHVNFKHRYSIDEMPFDEYKTEASYDERKVKEWHGIVYDCETEIFRTEGMFKNDAFENITKPKCVAYLDEHFPLWRDIHAYWD